MIGDNANSVVYGHWGVMSDAAKRFRVVPCNSGGWISATVEDRWSACCGSVFATKEEAERAAALKALGGDK